MAAPRISPYRTPRARREACVISDPRSQIEALFRRHAPGVGGYVVARTGDPDLAETITAEVFTLVVRKFDQCRGSPAAWLWAIVRSELARHFRDRRRYAALDNAAGDGLVDRTPTPAAALDERESHDRLHEALKQLDEEEHTIVYMKFFQDLPNMEIAEALNITGNLVGVRIHRTLKKLRGLMEGAEEVKEDQKVEESKTAGPAIP